LALEIKFGAVGVTCGYLSLVEQYRAASGIQCTKEVIRSGAKQLDGFIESEEHEHRSRMTVAQKSAFIAEKGYEKFMQLPE
jgi:hypothetical protein